MARAYAAAAGTHLFFGILCMAAGVTWLCLLYFYEPLFLFDEPFLSKYPEWVSVFFGAKIICGFWFFLTGAIGCCIKSKGCTEGVFVALNILNVIIWAPILLLIMVVLTCFLVVGPELLDQVDLDLDTSALETLELFFAVYPWLWIFPGVGLLTGVVEFILSIISYSMVCCCRPSQLNEGYEYQYEMK